MDFLGIGPLEFLLVVLVAFIILGPKEIQKTGKTIGRELNKFIKSDTWKTLRQASNKVKSLPNDLIREAGIEEIKKTLNENQIDPNGKKNQSPSSPANKTNPSISQGTDKTSSVKPNISDNNMDNDTGKHGKNA